ncbi:MAG: AbrB/MazE/SpoVT family DNA-binding domain-containing protein [Candidatus Heimdallarchaeota archaeon]|nr:AbrB/MazE/SpoVT family DNA-binding domain-containing protein [Candidatus Heimdallarchaeota archaeon]
MPDKDGIVIYFNRKIGKVGDSLYVTIPKELVEALQLKQGDELELYAKDFETLIIQKKK